MREIPEHGLVFDGHDTSRGDLIVLSREHLIAKGIHPLDADEVLAVGRVARAWWGSWADAETGESVEGFVGESHPGAQPVTVVHC